LLPKFSAEFSAMMTSAEQARDAWPLPDVPMILITARRAPRGLEHRSQIKLGYHQALIAQMPKATHVIAEKSGHLSQKDEPERVIQAVLQVVEEARAGHPGGGLPEKGVDTRHP
jgi:pimeloyl-ACP methyl ester carboxylesterase